jgi:beta-glucosidase
VRRQIADTNALVARLADGGRVRFLDVGQRLLEPDGTISADVMADFLHPTARCYRLLSEAIQPSLRELLGQRPSAR